MSVCQCTHVIGKSTATYIREIKFNGYLFTCLQIGYFQQMGSCFRSCNDQYMRTVVVSTTSSVTRIIRITGISRKTAHLYFLKIGTKYFNILSYFDKVVLVTGVVTYP